jgi:hypothetical protein
VYQVAEVVGTSPLATGPALSALRRTMRAGPHQLLVVGDRPALKVSGGGVRQYLDEALAKGVLRPPKEPTAAAKKGA